MRVTINQSLDKWVLCFHVDEIVYNSFTFNKLIEALECASLLKIHIANIDDLPLPQYKAS